MFVLPEPTLTHSYSSTDRTVRPLPAEKPDFVPPVPQRHSLGNGLNLLVVEKRGLPAVAFGLILNSGGAQDPVAIPGLAAFTTGMLQEGTTTRSSQQIAEQFEFMGSQLGTGTGRERTVLAAETLSRHFPEALELVGELVQRATFPEHELDRVRTERLTSLKRMREDPAALAARLAPGLLYGRQSSYGHPLSGTEEAIQHLSRQDLTGYFNERYGPAGSTLVVVGDISMNEVAELAEKCFGDWKGPRQMEEAIGVAQNSFGQKTTSMYLADKPGASQSIIRFGLVGVERRHPDYYALVLLNHMFGGQFTARLNLNLRQDKGYSYGYRSWIEWHSQSSLIMAGGGVQTEVTREAVQETLREFRDIQGVRQVTEMEFTGAKTALLRQLPSSFETSRQILEELIEIVSYNLPDEYFHSFTSVIEAVSLGDIRRVAEEHMATDNLMMLVVGDRDVVELGLRDIGFPVYLIDHEGVGA